MIIIIIVIDYAQFMQLSRNMQICKNMKKKLIIESTHCETSIYVNHKYSRFLGEL
jgi:hypothetical protein